MKFRKFGKALLMSALSAGAVFSVTSCVQSYTVGFLYVTGTQTSGTAGQGIISGFKIDHNTGKLKPINGLPVASGGSNPERAILLTGSRFLYVLNKGMMLAAATTAPSSTARAPGANIILFAVGGNGILARSPRYSPPRATTHSAWSRTPPAQHLFVLDHDAPDSGAALPTPARSRSAPP